MVPLSAAWSLMRAESTAAMDRYHNELNLVVWAALLLIALLLR